jgi:homoserine kinase type II
MAVYTEVSFDEAAAFLNALNLGQLQNIKGAAGGIENTNYFVDTDQGEYVLTLFERLTFEQLPFYLHLMKHLAAARHPRARPGGRRQRRHPAPAQGQARLGGQQAARPQRTGADGRSLRQVGEALARMHLAGLDYPRRQPNLRGLDWWNETVPVVLPFITPEQSSLILGELAFQNHVAASSACRSLPRGVVHADLFRDNVMFEDGKLTGFFDFYFAGVDSWLFDIAVCLNDWA